MKFSELSYLTLNSFSKKDSLEFIDPLSKTKKDFDIDSAIDFLIEHFKTGKTEVDQEESKKLIHWWNRNWTVSLDFYLSSTDEEKRRFSVYNQRIPKNIDSPFHIINLDKNAKESEVNLIAALINRRTHRKFLPLQLPLAAFSSLLGSISNISDSIYTQALDYYIAVFNIEEVPQGIYRYSQKQHVLEGVVEGNFRSNFQNVLCGMATAHTASFVIVMVADYEFLHSNLFFNRALRDLYMETGRIAQYFLIHGNQNGIGGLPSPAMKDTEMVSLLRLNIAQEIPVYSLCMGRTPSLASPSE